MGFQVLPGTLYTIFTILLTLWNSEQKNALLKFFFCFSSDFDETWWNCSTNTWITPTSPSFIKNQLENKNSFINGPFFCSEFQSVNRIVKIVHSAIVLSITLQDLLLILHYGSLLFPNKERSWNIVDIRQLDWQTETFFFCWILEAVWRFAKRLL